MSRSPRTVRRALVASATALALLVPGVAATAADTQGPSVTTSSVPSVAASEPVLKSKTSKKPAKVKRAKNRKVSKKIETPTKLKKVASYNHGARLQWQWIKGVKAYEIEFATDKAFTTGIAYLERKNPKNRPAGGVVAASVHGLENATKYYVRVRAIKGKKASKWSKTLTHKTKVMRPERFKGDLKATANPDGSVTFSWKQDTTYTTHYELYMARTLFNPQKKSEMPSSDFVKVKIPGDVNSYTVPAATLRKAGYQPGSGNHVYYRMWAFNKGTAGKKERILPGLFAVQPHFAQSSEAGTGLRVATYNITSARASSGKAATKWSKRVDNIAKTIVNSKAAVIGIQELSPGSDYTNGVPQTESLLKAVNKHGGGRYKLVRSTAWLTSNDDGKVGSQGARILYDTTKVELLSNCPDLDERGWRVNPSCTIRLNAAPKETIGRHAHYAKFAVKGTGVKFWFVSVHLSPGDPEKTYNNLRIKQATTLVNAINKLNTEGLPVIITGDMNSFQTRPRGNGAQKVFIDAGYVDSFVAPKKTNPNYSTYNEFSTSPHKYPQGFGARLDYILGKGVLRFETNINTKVPSSLYPAADHNIVVSDLVLPKGG